jgi:hypothetical protein
VFDALKTEALAAFDRIIGLDLVVKLRAAPPQHRPPPTPSPRCALLGHSHPHRRPAHRRLAQPMDPQMSGASRFSGVVPVGPGLIAQSIGLPLQVATLALVIRALRRGSRRTIGVAATAVAALALLHPISILVRPAPGDLLQPARGNPWHSA